MLSISDPYDLKAADVYRQARVVASKTSRGSDANWYREPGEIAFQWHLWFDGGRDVVSATLSRADNRWRQGPSLPLANLTTGEDVSTVLGGLISPDYFGQRPKALGVILHVADEFGLAEVASGADAGASEAGDDFSVLRYNLIDSPKDVLADREVSTDTVSWRLLPFWGAPSGQTRSVAVALPRSREPFLGSLVDGGEEWRLPVRVAVTSAPMEALAGLAALNLDLKGGALIALPYLKYTAVFALNEAGELRAARTLTHRGGSPLPVSFGDILWNMAVSAELIATDASGQYLPRLLVASAQAPVLEEAAREMEAYSLRRQRIHCETLDLSTHAATKDLPGHRPEFLAYDAAAATQVRQSPGALAGSTTGKALWDGWATQNFFHTVKIDGLYPSLADLRLLKVSTLFVALLALALIGTAGYGVYGLFTAMRHPSWNLTEAELKRTKATQDKLFVEQKQIDVTQRLLKPRSRGWATLEFLLQLFPEEAGVRLEYFSYTVDPVQGPPPGKGATVENIGMVRQWSFKGLAKAKTLDLLNNLNSQRGLTAFFDKVAQATEDPSYQPDPARQIRLTLTQGRNSRYSSSTSAAEAARDPSLTYPFTFEATISQSLTEKDVLALPIPKPF